VKGSTVNKENAITRKNLVSSLTIGLVLGGLIGLVAGVPLGWIGHRIIFQQRTAQVLLCRQQHYGLAEADLQSKCGAVY